MDSISSILKPISSRPEKGRKGYRWQEKSLEAIKKLADGKDFKGSIFKCYKVDERRADIALNDCEELGKMFSRYFLKVYSELNKI